MKNFFGYDEDVMKMRKGQAHEKEKAANRIRKRSETSANRNEYDPSGIGGVGWDIEAVSGEDFIW